ncbi:unnamed protein product, partial [Ectocarpus fasciculatus]
DLVDGIGGDDVLVLGRGDDVGVGGDGHDVIAGGRGMDMLTGGRGNDKLYGGRDEDTFIFNTGDGHDHIIGFEDGVDLIDLSGTGITSFAELEGAIHARGNRAEIEISADQSIFVQGARLDLTEDDFLF